MLIVSWRMEGGVGRRWRTGEGGRKKMSGLYGVVRHNEMIMALLAC